MQRMQAKSVNGERSVETMTAESAVFESFYDTVSGAWSLRRVTPPGATIVSAGPAVSASASATPNLRMVRVPARPRIRRVA